jgi:RND family efflux transporter MFP subunit
MLVAAALLSSRVVFVGAAEVEATPPSQGVVLLKRCEIDYKRSSLVGVAHMGTTTSSIVQDCYVRLGDRVKAGQILGRVTDRDIRAELELRSAEAQNDINIRVNEARYAEAMNKLKRSESLQKRVFVSTEELNGQELTAITSKLEIEQSKYQRHLAELQRRLTDTLLHAREYVSPHDGVVVEILKEQGEAVSLNEPIFRVVDVDVLKVSGYLNLNDFWRVRKGQEVRISPEIDGDELPVEEEVFTGHVVFVDSRIDPTTRTCKVVAEVPNRDLLLASGLEARMQISVGTTPKEGPTLERAGPEPPLKAERVSRTERNKPIGLSPESDRRLP